MNLDILISGLLFFLITIAWGFIRPKLFPELAHEGIEDGITWKRRATDAETTNRVLSHQIAELQLEFEKLKRDFEREKDENRELRYQLRQNNIMSPSEKEREVDEYMQALEKSLTSDEFETLCFENFKEVYDSFTTGQSGTMRRLALVDWAERNKQLLELRKHLLKINRNAFKR